MAEEKKDKSLRDKAIDFKGKSYVLVADRVIYFNDEYKSGAIVTNLVSQPESDIVIVKATVYPDGLEGRYFTGYSQAVKGEGYINKTSALENAETSAVGRALAMMGIGVIDSIASKDEINKAETYPKYRSSKEIKQSNDSISKQSQKDYDDGKPPFEDEPSINVDVDDLP